MLYALNEIDWAVSLYFWLDFKDLGWRVSGETSQLTELEAM